MKKIIVKKNEHLVFPVIWTGKESELSFDVKLSGPGATITFLALLLGKDEQTLDLFTQVEHASQNTKSEVIVKSALKDFASVNFEGLVKIDHGAKGTNAYLSAHILLLSKTSRGRAIPSLEILENDIKAGHATTVGRVNDLELFYLMSRGISEHDAKMLIISGFLQSIIDKFPAREQDSARKKLLAYGTN